MKQLQMTAALSEMIKKAVGQDVDTSGFAVFEARAINNLPLPGKKGSIFEQAVVAPITIAQMVDSINSGKHLPIIADHDLMGAPKGRFFHAGMNYEDGVVEMRALFYLDGTEAVTIAKLNSGSLDEVSVAFLSTQFLCSECGWDYFEFGTTENLIERTCANGHTIGTDGVHADMVGLASFIELSLVARGAADNPKIVGKSEARLAPEDAYRLAAHGFKPDELVVRASLGTKEDSMTDTTNAAQLMTDLTAEIRKTATLSVEKSGLETQLSAATTADTAKAARIGELEAELETLKASSKIPDDYEPLKASNTEAVTYLQEQLQHLTVAKTGAKLADDKLPTEVAALKAEISTLTGNLTSILPVGGKSNAAGGEGEVAKLSFNPDAFKTR